MTARAWTGAVNNDASNGGNWSPPGVPAIGDTLSDTLDGSTIDINRNTLADAPLTVQNNSSNPLSATLNLSHAQLNLTERSAGYPLSRTGVSVTANLSGHVDTLDATLISTRLPIRGAAPSTLAVNLTDHTNLFGSFTIDVNSTVTITGEDHAQFICNATNVLKGGRMVINTDVRGGGTFELSASHPNAPIFIGSRLQFGGFVSGGQTVDVTGALGGTQVSSTVVIDQPKEFHGTIDLHTQGLADLVGLAQADTWNYKNDLLTVRNGSGNVIDNLHIISDAPSTGSVHGLSVAKTDSGDILIRPGTDFKGSLGSITS